MIQRIIRNSGAQLLAFVVSLFDRLFVLGVLLRAWGPQVFAEWILLIALAGLVGMGELGLNIYYGNRLQAAFAKGNELEFRRIVGVALTCSFTVAAFVFLVFLTGTLSGFFSAQLELGQLEGEQANSALIMLCFVAASRIARGSISQIFRGRRDFFVLLLLDSVVLFAAAAVSVAVGLIGGSPEKLAVALLATDLLFGWGVMIVVLRKRYPELRAHPALPSRNELFDLFSQGKWLAIQQGAPVVWLQGPLLVLGLVGVSGSPLISFVVLRTLANIARSMCTMLSISAGVEIAHAHHASSRSEVVRSLTSVRLALAVLTASIAGGIMAFGSEITGLWTSRPELFDVNVVFALLVGTVFASASTPVASFLMLSQSARIPATAQLVQIGLGLTLCAALTPAYGVLGAAIGLAIGEVIASVILLPHLARSQLPELSGFGQQLELIVVAFAAALWSGFVGEGALLLFKGDWSLSMIAAAACWLLIGLLPPLVVSLPKALRRRIIANGKS